MLTDTVLIQLFGYFPYILCPYYTHFVEIGKVRVVKAFVHDDIGAILIFLKLFLHFPYAFPGKFFFSDGLDMQLMEFSLLLIPNFRKFLKIR